MPRERDPNLRSDGKPRADPERISEARRKSGMAGAVSRWQGHELIAWRTIRVHADTYARIAAAREASGLQWDDFLNAMVDAIGG